MLRTIQRAARAGAGGAAQKSSKSNTTDTTSPASPTRESSGDERDWELVDEEGPKEDGIACYFYDRAVFGAAPSKKEVLPYIDALKKASFSRLNIDRVGYNSKKDLVDDLASPTDLVNRFSPADRTEGDWTEPPLQLCKPRMLQRHGSDIVYDAFHLLQTDPTIQRMVVSLSSDKAVWDAVVNNEVVRELRQSLNEVNKSVPENVDDSASDGSNTATKVLSWILDNTKAKVMELIENITDLVKVLFQLPEDKKIRRRRRRRRRGATDQFEEKLTTSFLLYVVVLLMVVVSRDGKARS